MPKKYWILLIIIGLLLIGNGWLGLCSQNQKVQYAQLTLDSTLYPKLEIVHTTMKPAWYQFFLPRTLPPNTASGASPIAFIPQTVPQNPTLVQWFLYNQTQSNYKFPTQNGSLLMIQEAQDTKGVWKPIEYWTTQWGSSSMPVVQEVFVLAPEKAIMIVAPKYEGTVKTNMRFKYKVIDLKGKKVIGYSPIFQGSISPSQFEINPAEKKKGVSYLE